MTQRLGRYELIARLATGGMAEIWLARQHSFGGFQKVVALKRIRPKLARDPAFVEAFVAEARLAAELHHPNIAQIYDLAEIEGSPVIAMELVHGDNLQLIQRRSWELRGRPLDPGHAAWIVAKVCRALSYAHTAADLAGRPLGVVHRDVSPSNVLVSFRGQVKVVDFGIARAVTGPTAGGGGKVAYMSPEQCAGADVDARSDVFSAGIVLWEALTGVRLFGGMAEADTRAAIAGPSPVRSPLEVRADLDAGLVAVALKALAKAPADRYPTAAAMADALEAEVAAGGAVGPDDLAALVGSLLQDRRERWAAVLEAAQQATPPAPPAPPAAPPAPPAPGLNLDDPFDESSPAGAFLFEHDGSDLAAVTIPEPLAKPAEPSEQAATLSGLGGLKLATPEPEPDEASPPEAEAPSDTAPGLASAPPPIPEDEPALTGAAPRPFEPAPEPAPEPARRGWRAFDDGFEPDPFDDEEDEDDPPPVPSLQRLLAAGPSPEAEREPAATGASGGGLALEVLRVVRGRVRGAELLRRSGGSGVDRPLAGGVAKAALSEREIRVTPHAGVALAGAEAAGALTLQLGEGAELVDGDTTYRLRALVPPPPPKRGAARIPLAIYALALLIVAGVHLGTAPVLDGLEALGVTTAVDRPAPAEVFAEGTMRRPKPKRPPVAKPNKPKPRPNKVADKAPAPAPPKDVVSSVEAPPQIPKKMRQRISARMSGSRGKASTSSLIERLRTPRQGVGHTLKEVTTNIEAKAAGRQTDVHKVTGELLAMGGAEPQFATAGGGGEHRGPLAGEDVRGKITKKLSLKPNKSAGKVRGKVSGMRSRTKVKGSLDPALVYKVIDHNIGRIQSCYEKRLRVNPSLAGKITFRWKISTTGRVKGVRQHTSSLGDAKVSSCIQQILKRLRFPKPDGGEVEIFYPFIFRST